MTKIALIQMRCGAEPQINLDRAIEFVRHAARQGAEIVCLPELFRSQYFCQTEDHKNFDLAEEVPGKSTEALAEVARQTGTIIIASLFERRSAGLYHNTAANIAKCIFPMTRYITKSFTSRLAILGLRRGRLHAERSVCAFAGISGIRK